MEAKEETIKTKRPFPLLVALLAIVAMFAAACGDDEEGDTSSETAAAPTTAAAEPTTEAASSEAASEPASSEAASEPASSEEATTEASEPASSEAAVDGSGLKIGLVTDIGGLNDKGFNQLANEGLERAKTELGVTAEVRESKQPTDYVPNLSYFATQGYDLVVAVGFLMAKDLGTVAKQFPDTKFAIVDSSAVGKDIGGATNVEGLLFKEQEAGYLAGYLAATLKKRAASRG